MRIAINLEQLLYRAPGGTGRYAARVASLVAELFPADEVVPFVAWHPRADVEQAYRRFGIHARVPAPARLPLPRWLLADLWHTVGQPRLDWMSPALRAADVIHAPSVAVPPAGGKPLVVTVHDAGFRLFPDTYTARGRRFHAQGVAAAARRADIVLTVSRSAADEIVAHSAIRPERLRVVPNGVDHLTATPAEVEGAITTFGLGGAPYVLWVGSLEPRKNVATLVTAFAELAGGGRLPHRLVLAGPSGWLQEGLVPDRARAALGDRLRTVGTVTDSELRALYAGADLYAFPSLHEGFGLPVLEAMVQGTPVVCSDIPALREVAGDAALLVPPGDVDAWIEALTVGLSDEAVRKRLITDGYEQAGRFSWERTARETRAVYAELAGG